MTRVDHDRHGHRLVPAGARSSPDHDGVYAALGIDPHQAGGRTRRAESTSCASCSRHRAGGRGRRDGPRLPLRRRPARRAAPALRGAARARGRARPAGRHPHARRRRRHRGARSAASRDRRPALLLVAGAPRRRARARLVRLVRRQRHLPEGGRAARGGSRGPGRPAPRRDGQPVPLAAARPRPAERAGQRRPHRRRARRGARRGRRGARRADRRQRDGRLRAAVSVTPKKRARPALPRRREHPRRDRPARRARGATTSCSRSGRGSACSPATSPIASGSVHAVELDRSLEPASPTWRANVRLHCGDALALDLAALEPPPTKLVANLPYNVATPIVVESLDGLPTVGLWCVMVQREVADRFFAAPGTKAYGAVSVLVQLAAERTGFHPVSADRLPAAAERRLGARRLPADGAAAAASRGSSGSSRRRSRTGARRCRTRSSSPASPSREHGVEALAALGRPRDARAPRSSRPRSSSGSPTRCEDAAMRRAPAPAKLNLALVVGARARRRQARGRDRAAADRPRRPDRDRAGAHARRRRLRGGHARAPALERLAGAAGVEPRWRATIAKRIPVAAGLGGGSSDAATALRLANATLERPLPPERAARARRAPRRRRARSSSPTGPSSARGDGSELTPLDLPQDYWVLLLLPHGAVKASTADVYAAFAERGAAGRRRARAVAALDAALAAVRRPRDLAALPPNDLASSPLAERAARARRLPRRRHGCRAGRLRPLPPPRAAAAARRAIVARGRTWLTVLRLVRLSALATVCTMSQFPTHRAPPGTLRAGPAPAAQSTSPSGSRHRGASSSSSTSSPGGRCSLLAAAAFGAYVSFGRERRQPGSSAR